MRPASAAIEPPALGRSHRVIEGPEKVKNELVWRLELEGAEPAVLCQLLPELAAEESLRRRYAYELERLAARRAPRLAPIVAVGPEPDPRDPDAAPPWRLRLAPAGQRLEALLAERAPLPVDEAIALGAELADAVAGAHDEGWVVRDLEPRGVVLDREGRKPWLTDVGLARLHILTTLTASSLMLESTAYAAPEHVRATLVDPRADVYSLAVILWRALTGALPFGEKHALLRDHEALPPLGELRPETEPRLDALLRACLAEDPELRPENARVLAELLRGEGKVGPLSLERVTCQACGEPLRPGLRLCLSCGKQAIQFRHVEGSPKTTFGVYLAQAKEEEAFHAALRDYLEELGEDAPRHLEFLIGDARMYSKAERERRHALPAPLFTGLDQETAGALAKRLRERGLKAKIKKLRHGSRARANLLTGLGIGLGIAAPLSFALGSLALGFGLLAGAIGTLVAGGIQRHRANLTRRRPLARLRAAPSALPASDPLVARLAALLDRDLAPDLRERIGELALAVQRLVDRRAELADTAELDVLTEPVEPLVGHVERHARAIADIDAALAELDESALVRALAASEARREPREKRLAILEALDRLRELEDRRTAHLQRLLEASSLLRRAVELGLGERDEARLEEATRRLALADLDSL